jgi:myo-inositol 2-dehydrogenase/D-chiro-inositol 1-dehydrogenase
MALKLGIIGAGHMGTLHAQNLMLDKRVHLVGVADVDQDRAETLARLIKGRAFNDVESLLDSGVEAVYVCTPNTLHTEAVLTALQRHVHVFSEKPMATTLHQAQQIRAATRTSRGLYQVGHNRRFAPAYTFAKQQLQAGFVPTSANIKMNRGELTQPPWVADTRVTGGFLYESTVHLLDMMRWLMGEVMEVVCRARASVYHELDDFVMLFTCVSGQSCAFSSCAHATWAFPFERVELYGDHAQLVTEEMEQVTYASGLGQPSVQHNFWQLSIPDKWGYREEDTRFVGAIVAGTPPPVTAEDGYKAVELVEACYRSAQHDGERIQLPLCGESRHVPHP